MSKKELLYEEWNESKFSSARKNLDDLCDTEMNAKFEDPLARNHINEIFWSYVKSKSYYHRIPEVESYEDCIRSDPKG